MVRTPKGHKHEDFAGIPLPYWASLEGGLYGISLSCFLVMSFFGDTCMRVLKGFMQFYLAFHRMLRRVLLRVKGC